jgi:hypothetical protein
MPFNADRIAGPGETPPPPDLLPTCDNRSQLVVDGFDVSDSESPRAQGLPKNGRLDIYRLGPYDANNVFAFAARHLKVDVPRGRYTELRFLAQAPRGNDDGAVLMTPTYEDGDGQPLVLAVDNWRRLGTRLRADEGDELSSRPRNGNRVVLSGLDRVVRGENGEAVFLDENLAAIHEIRIPVDSTRELVRISIQDERVPTGAFAGIRIFALTAIRAPEK